MAPIALLTTELRSVSRTVSPRTATLGDHPPGTHLRGESVMHTATRGSTPAVAHLGAVTRGALLSLLIRRVIMLFPCGNSLSCSLTRRPDAACV
jgi:hypothetical protein